MHLSRFAVALLATGTFHFVAPLALAQSPNSSVAAPSADALGRDPHDARVAVPPLRYRSALAAHRAVKDDEPTDWREANDTTARVGGWRAYAKQAQAPDTTPPRAPAAASAAPAGASGTGHDGHHPR